MKSLFPPVVALLISIPLLFSCSPQQGNSIKTTRIIGTFKKLAGKKVLLSEINVERIIPLDSDIISGKGSFMLSLDTATSGIYLVKVDAENYVTLVVNHEKTIKVISDTLPIRLKYLVEGSEDSKKLAGFEMILVKNTRTVDSIVSLSRKYEMQGDFSRGREQLLVRYEQVFNTQKEVSRKFIESNCCSLASLLVIDCRFGQRSILTEKDDLKDFLKMDSCLTLKYPNDQHVLAFNRRLQSFLQQRIRAEKKESTLAVGHKIPDVTLENPQGKKINLRSLEGKKVILYFWASWDKRSRQTNKEMVRLYDHYQSRGLEVYAVALESNRNNWMGAIKADNLKWINVTDYLNIQSGLISLYNIPEKLPYFYLLNNNQFILFKGNSIAKLEQALKDTGTQPNGQD